MRSELTNSETAEKTLRSEPTNNRGRISQTKSDGQADAANQRITDTLGTQDDGQDPGGEGDGDNKQAA